VSLDRELAALRTTTALAAGDHIACVNYDREFPGSAALAARRAAVHHRTALVAARTRCRPAGRSRRPAR
jgi:hypothetical protein